MKIKEPIINVPEQFAKQKSNYELLRQKFMKREGNN